MANPELTILIPTLNEQLSIGPFLEWCRIGIAKAEVSAEILIVDSSTDETPEIALSLGARVLRTPKRGLGRAYIDAIPYVRGKYVLMGDADCTYDFREIGEFLREFRAGHEYVMGSRFKGYIEPHSMPALHRYFGTPLTTKILNFLYGTRFSDIHCGMRGITREALERIELESQSWEYASEMVLKSVCLALDTVEVPVRFLREPEGRSSHLKRNGWREPWRAGWINLKAMFLYGADFFLLRPGLFLLVLGLLLSLPVSFGPVAARADRALDELDDAGPDPGGARAAERLPGQHRASALQLLAAAHRPLAADIRIQPDHGDRLRADRGGHRTVRAFVHAVRAPGAAAAARHQRTAEPPGGNRPAASDIRLSDVLQHAGAARGQPSDETAAARQNREFTPMQDRVLITGGAGCIGSDLAAELLRRGSHVTVLDNLTSGKLEHVEPLADHPGFRFVTGDLLDTDALDTVMPGIDMVWHLAANPDVKFTAGDATDKDLKQNTLATYNVLESMRRHGVKRLGVLFDLGDLRRFRAPADSRRPAGAPVSRSTARPS